MTVLGLSPGGPIRMMSVALICSGYFKSHSRIDQRWRVPTGAPMTYTHWSTLWPVSFPFGPLSLYLMAWHFLRLYYILGGIILSGSPHITFLEMHCKSHIGHYTRRAGQIKSPAITFFSPLVITIINSSSFLLFFLLLVFLSASLVFHVNFSTTISLKLYILQLRLLIWFRIIFSAPQRLDNEVMVRQWFINFDDQWRAFRQTYKSFRKVVFKLVCFAGKTCIVSYRGHAIWD